MDGKRAREPPPSDGSGELSLTARARGHQEGAAAFPTGLPQAPHTTVKRPKKKRGCSAADQNSEASAGLDRNEEAASETERGSSEEIGPVVVKKEVAIQEEANGSSQSHAQLPGDAVPAEPSPAKSSLLRILEVHDLALVIYKFLDQYSSRRTPALCRATANDSLARAAAYRYPGPRESPSSWRGNKRLCTDPYKSWELLAALPVEVVKKTFLSMRWARRCILTHTKMPSVVVVGPVGRPELEQPLLAMPKPSEEASTSWNYASVTFDHKRAGRSGYCTWQACISLLPFKPVVPASAGCVPLSLVSYFEVGVLRDNWTGKTWDDASLEETQVSVGLVLGTRWEGLLGMPGLLGRRGQYTTQYTVGICWKSPISSNTGLVIEIPSQTAKFRLPEGVSGDRKDKDLKMVVGIGVDGQRREVFYTYNGEYAGVVASTKSLSGMMGNVFEGGRAVEASIDAAALCEAVSVRGRQEVVINTGHGGFEFDVFKYVLQGPTHPLSVQPVPPPAPR